MMDFNDLKITNPALIVSFLSTVEFSFSVTYGDGHIFKAPSNFKIYSFMDNCMKLKGVKVSLSTLSKITNWGDVNIFHGERGEVFLEINMFKSLIIHCDDIDSYKKLILNVLSNNALSKDKFKELQDATFHNTERVSSSVNTRLVHSVLRNHKLQDVISLIGTEENLEYGIPWYQNFTPLNFETELYMEYEDGIISFCFLSFLNYYNIVEDFILFHFNHLFSEEKDGNYFDIYVSKNASKKGLNRCLV